MNEANERAEQFKTEIAEMKLKTGRAGIESVLQVVGVLLMIGGLALAFGAYSASLNVTATTSNVDILDSNSDTVLAIAGLVMSVVGGFVFVRYSFARFLRFWLLRQIYEQRAVVEEAAGGQRTETS